MSKQSIVAVLLALAGAAQAQTTCSCDASATRTADNAALVALLTNKMVCANVGAERWQEWHNGSSSGPIVDYKLGPGVQPDPSETVGSYSVANNTVTYNYGAGGTYTYEVCLAAGGGSYTFCGSRNITGAKIGGAGLQPCSAVVNSASAQSRAAKR